MTKMNAKKTPLIILLTVVIALMACLLMASCQSKTTVPALVGVTDVGAGNPPLQPPTDHANRWETGGTAMCYGCHGAGDKANPMNGYAPAIPNDHYANGDATTKTLNAERQQCIQCHPVG